MTTTSMKKLLLALLAVAAVGLVAVVIVENTPERRMDRKLARLLRLYEDDPKQLYQRVVDDKDLLGFALVHSFLWCKGLDRCSCGVGAASSFSRLVLPIHQHHCDSAPYLKQYLELLVDFHRRIQAELCDCETVAFRSVRFPIIGSFPRRQLHLPIDDDYTSPSRWLIRPAGSPPGRRWETGSFSYRPSLASEVV